jgi:hypothetical protein
MWPRVQKKDMGGKPARSKEHRKATTKPELRKTDKRGKPQNTNTRTTHTGRRKQPGHTPLGAAHQEQPNNAKNQQHRNWTPAANTPEANTRWEKPSPPSKPWQRKEISLGEDQRGPDQLREIFDREILTEDTKAK